MANIRHLDLALLDWETRTILKALAAERQRLLTLAQESEDEDAAADAGNDSIEVSLLFDRLAEQATSVFGEQILAFDGSTMESGLALYEKGVSTEWR